MARTAGTTNLEMDLAGSGLSVERFAQVRAVAYTEAREALRPPADAVTAACGTSTRQARVYRQRAAAGEEPFLTLFRELERAEQQFRQSQTAEILPSLKAKAPDKALGMMFPDLDKAARAKKAARELARQVSAEALVAVCERFEGEVGSEEWGEAAAGVLKMIVDRSIAAMAEGPG